MTRQLTDDDWTGGCSTLAGTIDKLARRGFTGHFGLVGGELRVLETGNVVRPKDLVIREYHRFEGMSDPDDMAIVYALESSDGIRGTLTDAFGVYADPAVGAALTDVPIRKGTS
jgi:hypothetical protein